MPFDVIVDSADITSTTGHHTAVVHIEERDADGKTLRSGTPEKYGVSTLEIASRFENVIDKWLFWIGQDMLRKFHAREGVQTQLLAKQGTAIRIAD